MGGCTGIRADLAQVPVATRLTNDRILYSESAGRFIVTVAPEHKARFEALLKGCTYARVGVVTEERHLLITGVQGELIVDSGVGTLKNAWKKTFGALR
jgi:phosphoribosylformylglycinamidine synthase